MYKKLKKISKSRNKLIAVVTVLFIGMVFASVLLAPTDKLTTDVSEEFNFTQLQIDSPTPLEIEDIAQNNLDEGDIEESPFICTINGKKYLAEYITREDVEEMKKQSDLRDSSKNYSPLIAGHGTELASPTEEELDSLIGTISIKGVISESIESSDSIKTSSPASIDLSSEIYFPPVGNQGGQGSCASWANVYYAYGYMEARDNGWNAKSGNPEYLLSPAWIYNKISSGTWPFSYGKAMMQWGVATLNTMPYDAGDSESWGDEAAWREAPYHRPLNYYTIKIEDPSLIDTIKSLLESKTPVTFLMDHHQYGNGLNKATGDYILSSEEYDSVGIGHANCFVGYDDSITEGSDVGAFRVVNSWGDSWMDGGFYWLTYEAFKEFGYLYKHVFYTDRIDYKPSLIATWEFSSAPTRMHDIITLGVGPHDVPLDTITPDYSYLNADYLFPTFMALDISEFHSYYDSDNTVNFYLELGSSTTTGIISSFLVERYAPPSEGGGLKQITLQSPDVPKTTPGHVNIQFWMLNPGPIAINDARSNNWEWAKTQGWCYGSGTQTHPYVIEDLTINCGGSGNGIKIKNSIAYFTIQGCTISNSGSGSSDAGIKLYNTDNGYIINNDLSQNKHGIFLEICNDNNIYYNYFIDNSIQARDDGTNNNNWDDGTIGNYWSDYNGIDNDGDGIGETPYPISGTAGAIDNNPMANIQLPLIADFEADITTVRKGKPVQFTFTGREGNPPTTFEWYFCDGTDVSYERNPTHTYTKVGKYWVALVLTDADGEIVSELKIDYITVKNPPKPVPGFTFYIFLITSIIGGASVIFMLKRKVIKSVKIPKK